MCTHTHTHTQWLLRSRAGRLWMISMPFLLWCFPVCTGVGRLCRRHVSRKEVTTHSWHKRCDAWHCVSLQCCFSSWLMQAMWDGLGLILPTFTSVFPTVGDWCTPPTRITFLHLIWMTSENNVGIIEVIYSKREKSKHFHETKFILAQFSQQYHKGVSWSHLSRVQ